MRGVEDWSDCFDLAELRIRLRADNARLRGFLDPGVRVGASAMLSVPEPVTVLPVSGTGGLPYADASSSAEAQITLFRALFAGREDVYARRWVSASPAGP